MYTCTWGIPLSYRRCCSRRNYYYRRRHRYTPLDPIRAQQYLPPSETLLKEEKKNTYFRLLFKRQMTYYTRDNRQCRPLCVYSTAPIGWNKPHRSQHHMAFHAEKGHCPFLLDTKKRRYYRSTLIYCVYDKNYTYPSVFFFIPFPSVMHTSALTETQCQYFCRSKRKQNLTIIVYVVKR